MHINIDLIRESKLWSREKSINKALCRKVFQEVIKFIPSLMKLSSVEMCVVLTTDYKIQKLNNNFRKKNKTTNVLSFPDRELNYKNLLFNDNESLSLGDAVFSFETIDNELNKIKIPFENHFTHLLVHAILHLLGYDHENEDDADVMEKLEIEILNRFNIPSPY